MAVCAASPAPAVNTLTAPERAQGWRLLFNGKDLSGWKVYRKDAIPPQWQVQDGAIALTAGGAGDLMTAEEYGDFDLQLEWKISPKGNSGVIYRVKEDPSAPNTYNSGPEMQVLDNDGHADGKTPSHRAGAIYDLVVPKEGAVRPVGEWNQARIVLRKGHVEHWLNGQKVAESSYGDAAWRKLIAGSKFKDMPLFGRVPVGHIALQDHGNKVWFRNIKIRRL
ncbi:MAG: hypothetical protein JWO33_1883 [Caulobacteraceae bacterium]|nr:hypothetical protein [Caulobacteraceae bacterium]